jgi:hypothetical protein
MERHGATVGFEGAQETILIGTEQYVRAQEILAAHPAVRTAAATQEGIIVTLRPGFPMTANDAAADINRVLVEAGFAVHRVEPRRLFDASSRRLTSRARSRIRRQNRGAAPTQRLGMSEGGNQDA